MEKVIKNNKIAGKSYKILNIENDLISKYNHNNKLNNLSRNNSKYNKKINYNLASNRNHNKSGNIKNSLNSKQYDYNKSDKLNLTSVSSNSLTNNPKLSCDNKVKLIDVSNGLKLSNLASVSSNSKYKKTISIFEITLLVLTIFSFSWIIGNVNDYNNTNLPNNNSNKNIFRDLINNIFNFIDIIPSVSAQSTTAISTSVSCCVNSQSGNSCREFPSSQCGIECDGTCLPTSCGETTQCKPGCCYDTNEGLCDPNSLKQQCEEKDNGVWADSPLCEARECVKGCCVLGLNAQFVTEQRCRRLSQLEGLTTNFKPEITDELSCLGIANAEKTGACVYGEEIAEEDNKRNCKFTTKEECDLIPGEFNEGKLCSNTALNTVCEKQKSTNCVEGRDEIYWFDSCGNAENIYSSDKQRAWNNGLVLSESQSCNPNSNNAGSSTCGNCDYNLGSICGKFRPGIDDGNLEGYTCRDLNCKNAPDNANTKKNRLNGESWCVYDGQIGGQNLVPLPSKDVVGSRHFRYVCENGEVVSEPCADYRKEICVENDKTLSNGKKISDAICRVNMWEQCISLNGQKGCEGACLAKCPQNPDCRVFPVFVGKDFKFNACVPKYPPGFDLSSTSGISSLAQGAIGSQISDQLGGLGDVASSLSGQLGNKGTDASQICGLASQTCTVTYQKVGIPPVCKWECVGNCACMEAGFTTQMTNLCASLGDCGVKANIAGVPSFGGAYITKKGSKGHLPPQPFILAPLFIIFAKATANQKADGGFFKKIPDISSLGSHGIGNIFGDGYARTRASISGGGPFGSGQLGNTLTGVGIGALAGTIAYTASLTVGLPGVGIIQACIASGFSCVANPYVLVAVVIVVALGALSGCGKIEQVEIKYNCQPWQRPSGGGGLLEKFTKEHENVFGKLGGKRGCEFCNNDKLKPCTRYRCESLGARCKLINEGTGQDTCITDDQATGIPIITPWNEILNNTLFSYQDVSNNGFRVRTAGNECIEAFTILSFGVKTDVYSQCRWSVDVNATEFDEMMPFLEQNLFTKNHSLISILPSVESIIASETGNSEEFQNAIANPDIYNPILNQIGDLNIHVKCSNIDGQTNAQDYRINLCVKPGPDLTPPVIYETAPPENSIVALNATQQEAVFFINEPSECKWDVIKPTSTNMQDAYFNLSNSMSCETDVFAGTLLGFPCNVTLPFATGNESKFYILCRDQPWLAGTENETKRNFGAKDGGIYEYKLQRSPSELKINSISPSGIITRGAEPISIELEATTAGGGYKGVSSCEFEGRDQNGNTWGDNFPETATSHKYLLNQMMRGNYTINVKCLDNAGNYAENSTSFNLMLDTQYPSVTRIYYSSGSLAVLTDEDSTCVYSNSNDNNSTTCSYDFASALKMNGNTQYHDVSWDTNSTFYIKCADIWGNKPGSCSIIAKPNNVAGVR